MGNYSKVIPIVLFILTAFSTVSAQAVKTSIIKGKVVDKETGNPLEAASVYFTQTTIGTTVKKNGEFKLEVEKPGNYELAASMVGYETQRRSIYVDERKEYSFQFHLTPRPVNTKPVEVVGEDRETWRRNLEIFKEKFLGNYKAADSCIVQNLEYVNFEWKGRFLIAKTDTPIVVINKFLGYKVKCELLHFEYNPYTKAKACFMIPFFTELEPENEARKMEWKKNRKEIYLGSPEHFLISLRNNRLAEEGYRVYHVTGIGKLDQHLLAEVEKWEDIKYEKQISGNPTLFFENYLRVVYKKTELSYLYLRFSFFMIGPNGIADNHLPFITFGFWTNLGTANLMPRDYLPEDLFNYQNKLEGKYLHEYLDFLKKYNMY